MRPQASDGPVDVVSVAAQRRSIRIKDEPWQALEAIAAELNEGRDPDTDPLRAVATTSMVVNMAIREYLKQRAVAPPVAAA